jgi:hypothetical protein
MGAGKEAVLCETGDMATRFSRGASTTVGGSAEVERSLQILDRISHSA